MKKFLKIILFSSLIFLIFSFFPINLLSLKNPRVFFESEENILNSLISVSFAQSESFPSKDEVVSTMKLVNDYWMGKNQDGGDYKWANSVYHIGNLAYYEITKDEKYYNYSYDWAEKNDWKINQGIMTRHADYHCIGQAFIYLYEQIPEDVKIIDTVNNINAMVASPESDDWSWIDAMHMAMPVFAKIGSIYKDPAYFNKMYDLYYYAKINRGLYDEESGFWYRDESFKYPQNKTSRGKKILWSRGNGWVFVALTKVLKEREIDTDHASEYQEVFRKMAESLKNRQRSDGFWNSNLDDPYDHQGPETSGTSAFIYGLSWGINNGILDPDSYIPVVRKAWNGLVQKALHSDGKLGYVQEVGSSPYFSTYETTSNFGVGLFLMAGSEFLNVEDKIPPIGAIKINRGAIFTKSNKVSLSIRARDISGVRYMKLSNNASTWTPWLDYKTSYTWNLASTTYGGSNAQGKRYVWAVFKDRAGNVSTRYYDTIIYDSYPPRSLVKINYNAAYTRSRYVNLYLRSIDKTSGTVWVKFSNNGSKWTGWLRYNKRLWSRWNFTSAKYGGNSRKGRKYVYVIFRDRAGNMKRVFDSIVFR